MSEKPKPEIVGIQKKTIQIGDTTLPHQLVLIKVPEHSIETQTQSQKVMEEYADSQEHPFRFMVPISIPKENEKEFLAYFQQLQKKQ
jgi:hypothetical protein